MKRIAPVTFSQEEIAFYLKDVRKCSVLSDAEEKSVRTTLVELGKNADPNVRRKLEEQLIKSNLRFVITIAKDYQGSGLDLCDIIQEGNMGLLKACYLFDPSQENKFISYAVHWIRQSIMQALNEKSRTIRIPVNIVAEIGKSKNAMDEHEMYLNDLESAYPTTVGLDASIDEDGNTLLDLIPNRNAHAPDSDLTVKEDLKSELQRMLGNLDERERIIIEDYYGISGTQRTLEEIGEDLEPRLTKERVRQIKDKALKKLRDESTVLFQYL